MITKIQGFNQAGYVEWEATGKRVTVYRAAPDLLAALIELERVESSPHSETVRFLAREQAREAIKLATGAHPEPPLSHTQAAPK
jgi:hypothetical protein